MQLWIGIHMPAHSLDTLFPLWSEKALPAAALWQDRVYALTPAAREQGLCLGMQRNTVAGLAPGVILQNRDLAAEHQRLRCIALDLLQYTPNVILNPVGQAHTLLLEVATSLSLFKGPRNLCHRIHASLRQYQTLHYHLSMSPTAQGARVLACQSQTSVRRTTQMKTLHRRLGLLPVNLLSLDQTQLDWLNGIGCHTLRQLQNLPRNGVRQRCSSQVIDEVDAIYGRGTDPHHLWFKAPELFSCHYNLPTHVEHVQTLQAVAGRLIERLCVWLQARQCAADTLVFVLHHEKGRHARPPSRLVLLLSRAGWQPDDFSQVLDQQLRRFTLHEHVIALDLSIPGIQPRPVISGSLLPEPTQWQADELRLIDLLRARLGSHSVLEPQQRADYRPERANNWVPAAPGPASQAGAQSKPIQVPGRQTRPFWLLPQPRLLTTHNDQPLYKGVPLRLIRGPERIETGWWEDAGCERRDYFIARDAKSAHYWIYRQREALDARWFLHGLFG
jgi:protein ImuB